MNSRINYTRFLDLYLSDDMRDSPVSKLDEKYIQKYETQDNGHKDRAIFRKKPNSELVKYIRIE